jgi:hypothetical protein
MNSFFFLISKSKKILRLKITKKNYLQDSLKFLISNRLCQKGRPSTPLRGYWSLELVFLDQNLVNQGFEDIIQISQFVHVDLAFSLREKCVNTFLYAHTPWHISDTKKPKPKWFIYLLLGFILK